MHSIEGCLFQYGTHRNGLIMKPIKFKLQGSLLLGGMFTWSYAFVKKKKRKK